MRRHLAAFLLAGFIGLLMISSQLALRVWVGEEYRGIAPILSPATQDSAWYHAVIHETLEGGRPWNAILAEQKDSAYPVPDLAERLLALPGRLLSIEADTLLLIWRFILPAALALVVYVTGIVLVRSRLFALTSTVLVLCCSYAAYAPGLTFSILRGTGKALLYTLYDRPVHPQFDAPLLWSFLILTVLSLIHIEKKRLWLVSGVLLGLLTHSYVWAWTWGYAALAVLLLQSFFQNDPRAARSVLKMWGVAICLGLPALIPVIRSVVTSPDPLYAERLALVSGHALAPLSFNFPVVLALVVLFLSRRFYTLPVFRFTLAGLGATFIALNQQVVTGVAFQPDHYLQLISSAIVLWVLAWAVWVRVEQLRPRLRLGSVAAVTILSLFLMGGLQWRIFQQTREYTKDLQRFADVATWLNGHADRSTVVFANQHVGLLIPAYTDANLWWHFYAMGVPVESTRIQHAAFTWFLLGGLRGQDVSRAAELQPLEVSQYFTLTTNYEQRLRFLREQLPSLIESYDIFRQANQPSSALRRYRVDYVLFDKQLDRWNPSQLGVDRPVVENERFVLYSVLP